MVNYNLPLYQHPQETWDAAKCRKLAKKRWKNAFGDSMAPWPGFLPSQIPSQSPFQFGEHRYNGGCWRADQWWQGEEWPMPILAPGFEIIHVTSWGYRIVEVQGGKHAGQSISPTSLEGALT